MYYLLPGSFRNLRGLGVSFLREGFLRSVPVGWWRYCCGHYQAQIATTTTPSALDIHVMIQEHLIGTGKKETEQDHRKGA